MGLGVSGGRESGRNNDRGKIMIFSNFIIFGIRLRNDLNEAGYSKY